MNDMAFYETAPYEVLEKEGALEIRKYGKFRTASVRESDLRGVSGFNRIFNFIGGENQARKKIPMTTPVLNDMQEGDMTTEFVMPAVYRDEPPPAPLDPDIRIREYEEELIGAIIFSGSVSKEKIVDEEKKLRNWLLGKPYQVTGALRLARYNPPFIPPFLRRNEILIPIKYRKDEAGK